MSALRALVFAAGVAGSDEAAPASCSALFAGAQTVTRAPGPQYAAGGLRRMFLGSTNRKFWTTAIEVPVLDLASFGGGLTAKERAGSKQTRGLKFEAGNGHQYRFRSTDKSSSLLAGGIGRTPVGAIIRDQFSADTPAGAVVVTPLSRAADVPGVTRCLVVLPDDPKLGEFQKEFAGMLGTLEESPRVEAPVTAGFEEITQLVDDKELVALLDADPTNRIDARAFLKARLFDIWINDWDRHHGQWDWGRRRNDGRWVPVPKDRDEAFVNHDGLLLDLARLAGPRILEFGPRYGKTLGYIYNSRDQDRRFLAELDLAAWNDVAAELRTSLSDAAIDAAVAWLPRADQEVDAGRLAADLKARREALPRQAQDLYRMLSDKVDVYATGAHEVAEIQRFDNGEVELRLAPIGDRANPYFRRRFVPDETSEIRVFLNDGNDRVVTSGRGSQGPLVRVVGGNGADVIEGSLDGIRLYDADSMHPKADSRLFEQKTDENGNRPFDWGSSMSFYPMADVETDIGLVLGAALSFKQYGFRADPFRLQHTFSAETATNTGWRFGYEGELHRTNSRDYALLNARYSEIESLRFYGFGNESLVAGSSLYHHVDQKQYLLAPSYVIVRGATKFGFGPVAKYSDTNLGPEHFIGSLRPYGSGEFGQVGAQAGLDIDTREPRRAARKGVRLRLGGSAYPALWSVRERFGEMHGDASFHIPIPIPSKPSLGFRLGAKQLFGLYPFHEAAYLGGTQTVRGISRNRFAGDAYGFGNAELRLRFTKWLGVFGLADAGRVFLDSEDSDQWHTSVGGGLWLSFGKDKHVISFTSARSEGHTSFYVKSGLAF